VKAFAPREIFKGYTEKYAKDVGDEFKEIEEKWTFETAAKTKLELEGKAEEVKKKEDQKKHEEEKEERTKKIQEEEGKKLRAAWEFIMEKIQAEKDVAAKESWGEDQFTRKRAHLYDFEIKP